jgi:hypothetical protein
MSRRAVDRSPKSLPKTSGSAVVPAKPKGVRPFMAGVLDRLDLQPDAKDVQAVVDRALVIIVPAIEADVFLREHILEFRKLRAERNPRQTKVVEEINFVIRRIAADAMKRANMKAIRVESIAVIYDTVAKINIQVIGMFGDRPSGQAAIEVKV